MFDYVEMILPITILEFPFCETVKDLKNLGEEILIGYKLVLGC